MSQHRFLAAVALGMFAAQSAMFASWLDAAGLAAKCEAFVERSAAFAISVLGNVKEGGGDSI